jgi:hypothetical protein
MRVSAFGWPSRSKQLPCLLVDVDFARLPQSLADPQIVPNPRPNLVADSRSTQMCGKNTAVECAWIRIGRADMKPLFEELSCGGFSDAKH